MVEQNLFICVSMSAAGGFLSVAARAVVLDHKRKQAKKVLDQQQAEEAAREVEQQRQKKISQDCEKMLRRSSSLLQPPPKTSSSLPTNNENNNNNKKSTIRRVLTSNTDLSSTWSSSSDQASIGVSQTSISSSLVTKRTTLFSGIRLPSSSNLMKSNGNDDSISSKRNINDSNDVYADADADFSSSTETSNGNNGEVVFVDVADLESQRQRQLHEEQFVTTTTTTNTNTNTDTDTDTNTNYYPENKNKKDSTTKSVSSTVTSSSRSAAPAVGSRYEMYKMLAVYLVLCAMLKPLQFFAPWFGPVTITWPVYVGSRMVSNLAIVGVLMGHEVFDKSSQVATMVVVSSVIFITLTGPTSGTAFSADQTTTDDHGQQQQQQERNIKELVQGNWIAMVWLTILAVVFIVSSGVIMLNLLFKKFVRKTLKLSPFGLEAFIFLNAITTSTLSFTTSRGASTLLNDPNDHVYRVTLTAVSWYIFMWWMVESYVEGRDVRSLKLFVPTETLGSVLLNFITGLLVWDDASAIVSWPGYLTSIALLAMGVYLFSDLDFFQRQLDEVQEYFYDSGNDDDIDKEEEDWRTRSEVEDVLMPHQRSMLKHQQRQQTLASPPSSTFLSEVDGTTTTGTGCQRQIQCSQQSQRPKLEKTFSDPEIGTRSRRFDGYSISMPIIDDSDDDDDDGADDDEAEEGRFYSDDELEEGVQSFSSLESLESEDETITA